MIKWIVLKNFTKTVSMLLWGFHTYTCNIPCCFSHIVYCLQGSIAYVPQQAWVQHMTLKDNIIFGKKVNEKKYKKIIDACALEADLNILPAGDQTEIGEKV